MSGSGQVSSYICTELYSICGTHKVLEWFLKGSLITISVFLLNSPKCIPPLKGFDCSLTTNIDAAGHVMKSCIKHNE